ncbi:MAG: DUF3786 domain-containing protein [Methanotrichaceae archaeon]|nr:DUF3786 domain-containing protein [Methanotrichaceae archaeon]
MTYGIALDKAWKEIDKLSGSKSYTVSLLMEAYKVKVRERTIIGQASGMSIEDYISVLILHYLAGILRHSYRPVGEWISFRELKGGDSYFPAYRKNTIIPIVERLARDKDSLFKDLVERFNGKIIEGGDFSVRIATFPDVYIRIIIGLGDEELTPEVTMLFDKNLADILMTEDIAIFLNFISSCILREGLP